jgi:hypothetical protein
MEDSPLNNIATCSDINVHQLRAIGDDSLNDNQGTKEDQGVDLALKLFSWEEFTVILEDRNHVDNVSYFTNNKEGGHSAVNVNVVENIKEADHWTEHNRQ